MNQFSQQLAALDIHREGVRNFRIGVAFLRTWAFRPLGLQTFRLLSCMTFRPLGFQAIRRLGL